METKSLIQKHLLDSRILIDFITEEMVDKIIQASGMVIDTLRKDGCIAFCGNGGSAAECEHLAGEFIGRFLRDRHPWNAVSFTASTSILTSIANDYGYQNIFARQITAGLRIDDVLFILSTSGNSRNCIVAAEVASQCGVKTIGLTGRNGGELRDLVDLWLGVPSDDTPRIQEAHLIIGHIICDIVERTLS